MSQRLSVYHFNVISVTRNNWFDNIKVVSSSKENAVARLREIYKDDKYWKINFKSSTLLAEGVII